MRSRMKGIETAAHGAVAPKIFIVVLVLMACALTGDARAQEMLRVGVVESLFQDTPEKTAKSSMTQFEAFMRAQTERNGECVIVKNAFAIGAQLHAGKLQLGTFHGVEFAWARQKYPKLTPLVIIVNQKQTLRALLLVRQDSPATDFGGLKDKALAIPSHTRAHCRLFLERLAQKNGSDEHKYFSMTTKPDNLEDALDDVVDGAVHAVLADELGVERYQARKPARFAKLKVVEKSVSFPTGVVAHHAGLLDDETIDRTQKALLHAAQSAEGRQILLTWKMTGFETVPREYEKLLVEIVKSYPPPADK